MSNTAIKVENLSKLYRLGEVGTGTISHDLNRWWARVRGKEDPYAKIGQINDRTQKAQKGEHVYALKDINFEVQQGEVLGIIGKNGAGKSTLLKLLSKITAPTTGSIKARGRIASLLEVGTGMHPEMTGIENVYLNGTILGMTRREISAKLDDILDFAGCAKYGDTPVKRYSSGMKVRLGFAVAAFLEPEILIVDEVLAVGDAEFQKRAIGKMQDISRGGGRTVLFVSHNMQSITTLTNRCLVLDRGKVIFDGDTSSSINTYLKSNSSKSRVYASKSSSSLPKIVRAEVKTSNEEGVHVFGKALEIDFIINTPIPLKGTSFSFQVVNNRGIPIVHLWTFDSERRMCREPGDYKLKCIIDRSRLYMGDYYLKTYLSGPPGGDRYEMLDGICPFKVEMYQTQREFKYVSDTCTYIEDCDWEVNKIYKNDKTVFQEG